jgi:hypothetical protein
MYRVAVGKKKADHYSRLFLKFDQASGSPISWNWAAFFFTFYWLLYRRMFVSAIVYIVGVPVACAMLALAISSFLSNGSFLIIYLVAITAVQYAVVPAFANAWYHRHVRALINKASARTEHEGEQLQLLAGALQTSASTPCWVAGLSLILVTSVFVARAISQ